MTLPLAHSIYSFLPNFIASLIAREPDQRYRKNLDVFLVRLHRFGLELHRQGVEVFLQLGNFLLLSATFTSARC